jgi:5,10-methylenetetrahydromethanopterin reductase
MADRLALGVIPGTGWRAHDIQMVAREAEDAGFDAVFTAEVNNDALATAQLMGAATQHIQVGTWVANIYLRHPYVCAQGAALVADLTAGRFILGLGVSHQPVNQALEVDMSHPSIVLRQYVTALRAWLRGEGPATHLPQRPAAHPVPLHVATLTSPTVELGGELADGIMPFLWSAARVKQSQRWVARGRAKSPTLGPLTITLGLPTFIGSDLETLRDAARQNLRLFTTFPLFPTALPSQWLCAGGNSDGARSRTRGADRPPVGCSVSPGSNGSLLRATCRLSLSRCGFADPASAGRSRGRPSGYPGVQAIGVHTFRRS